MLTVNSLSKLLSKGKSETFECREGKALTPRYITELYSAFANTYGGVLVLGIKEDPEKNFSRNLTVELPESPTACCGDESHKMLFTKINKYYMLYINYIVLD